MTIAFLLVNCALDWNSELLKVLKTIPEVKEAHKVFGAHDVLVKIEVDSADNIPSFVIAKIRKLDKIISTQTLLVTDEPNTTLAENQAQMISRTHPNTLKHIMTDKTKTNPR